MAGTRKANKGAAKKTPLGADEAMCMTCKLPRKIKDGKVGTLANGRKMMRGTCPVCSGKVVKFVSSK